MQDFRVPGQIHCFPVPFPAAGSSRKTWASAGALVGFSLYKKAPPFFFLVFCLTCTSSFVGLVVRWLVTVFWVQCFCGHPVGLDSHSWIWVVQFLFYITALVFLWLILRGEPLAFPVLQFGLCLPYKSCRGFILHCYTLRWRGLGTQSVFKKNQCVSQLVEGFAIMP